MDHNYIVQVLKSICETPSPSGYSKKVFEIIETEFKNFGMKVQYTKKGGLITYIEGKNSSIKKAIAAHADTLGAMVKEIKNNGRIVITPIGGYMPHSVECENCYVHTVNDKTFSGTIYTIKPSVHVHSDSKTLERSFDNMELLLDSKVSNKQDINDLGIEIGDYISFDSRFRYTDTGYIKSRHLDDKASIAIILGVCKYIYDNKIIPKNTIQIYLTNHEEIGHGASSGLDCDIDELLCVDMGAPGTGQNTDEYTVSICAKDSGGPYDYELKNKLVKMCKDNNIDYRVDIYPNYGSDGGAALKAGMDIKVGLIGAGIYASHSYERTHMDSVSNTAKLLLEYIKE